MKIVKIRLKFYFDLMAISTSVELICFACNKTNSSLLRFDSMVYYDEILYCPHVVVNIIIVRSTWHFIMKRKSFPCNSSCSLFGNILRACSLLHKGEVLQSFSVWILFVVIKDLFWIRHELFLWRNIFGKVNIPWNNKLYKSDIISLL